MELRAFAMTLALAGCSEQGTSLALPELSGGSIVLVAGEVAFAMDVSEVQTLELRFPDDEPPLALFAYDALLRELQLDVDGERRLKLQSDGRGLPDPARAFAWNDAWAERDDEALRAKIRVAPFDAERCYAGGGCTETTLPAQCIAPCPVPALPVPPAPPAPPTGPAAPVLSPCPAHTRAVAVEGVEDCVTIERPACGADQVRPFGATDCAPLGVCPAGAFADEAADLYVAPMGSGRGLTPADPLGTLEAALALAPAGALISLSSGDHVAPPSGVSRVRLRGACAERTHLTGALTLGAGASVGDLSVDGPLTVQPGARVELSRVFVQVSKGPSIFVGPQAHVVGTEVHVSGGGLDVRTATLSLSHWSVRDAVSCVSVVGATLRLDQGVAPGCELSVSGGDARVRGLDADLVRAPGSIRASAGAHLVAEDVRVGGVLGATGAHIELTRARTNGLDMRSARLQGSDLRIIEGLVWLDEGSVVTLDDVLRVRTTTVPAIDDLRGRSSLELHRAVFRDASFHVEGTATATITDLRSVTRALELTGLWARGRVTAKRLFFERSDLAVQVEGWAQLEDLQLVDTNGGVFVTKTATLTVSRLRAEGSRAQAFYGLAPTVVSDLELVRSRIETVAELAHFAHGSRVDRVRLEPSASQYHGMTVGQPEARGPLTRVADVEISSASTYSNLAVYGDTDINLERVKLRGSTLDGVMRAPQNGLYLDLQNGRYAITDLDCELPTRSSHHILMFSVGSLDLRQFHLVGATDGVREGVIGSELSLQDGVIEGHARSALVLPPGVDPTDVLDRVRISGQGQQFSKGE